MSEKTALSRAEIVKRVFDLTDTILRDDSITATVMDGHSDPCDNGDFVQIKVNGVSGKIFSVACDSPSACLQDCMKQIVKLLERGIS
jgi:hypothetical protein